MRSPRYPVNVNYNHCENCRKPLKKTARMDARYCSKRCRMAALRQREREKLLLKRAEEKAVQARRTSYAKSERVLQRGLAARYLERQQGERRAAKLPDLKEDPWLNMVARREAYRTVIAHYQKLLANVENKLTQTPPPPNTDPTWWTYTSSLDEKFTWPSYVTAIGLTVLPNALDRAVLIRTNQPLNAKDEAALKPAPKSRDALPGPSNKLQAIS